MSERASDSTDGALGHLRTLVLYTGPCLAAFLAWWIPMFDTTVRDEWDGLVPDGSALVGRGIGQAPLHERVTLLGLVRHPGETGPRALMVVAAVAVIVLLAACVVAAVRSVGRRDGWERTAVAVLAGLALVAVGVLYAVVSPDDGSGRLGTDQRDILGAFWLLVIVPVWFLVARARDPEW